MVFGKTWERMNGMAGIKRSGNEMLFDILNYIILSLLAFSTLYPFLIILSTSLSSPAEATRAGLRLIPGQLNLNAYINILKNDYLLLAYRNTIIRTVIGTLFNVLLTVMTAYPLSKKDLPKRNLWTSIIVFTMFFSSGLIPNYILVYSLGLTNKIWALILPGAINTYTMIIVRNFFMSLPAALEESAKLDGANDIRILFQIILPVSASIVATITLWYSVAHWNAWFDALIYITKDNMIVLQVLLRKMVIEGSAQYMGLTGNAGEMMAQDTTPTPDIIKSAAIMASSIPIIMVYPFIQKYFIKGIMVGSLKG